LGYCNRHRSISHVPSRAEIFYAWTVTETPLIRSFGSKDARNKRGLARLQPDACWWHDSAFTRLHRVCGCLSLVTNVPFALHEAVSDPLPRVLFQKQQCTTDLKSGLPARETRRMSLSDNSPTTAGSDIRDLGRTITGSGDGLGRLIRVCGTGRSILQDYHGITRSAILAFSAVHGFHPAGIAGSSPQNVSAQSRFFCDCDVTC
jgi:hypothetical protein